MAAGIATAAIVAPGITYQGTLTNAAGTPLTGSYSVTFSVYDVATGGTALMQKTQTVTCANGVFTTAVTLDPSYFDGRALWLGIKVGTDPEMTPRQEIRTVPYALSLRPGASIAGTGTSPSIDLWSTGSKPALNVTTGATNSDGVYVNTLGSSSYGLYVRTKGTGSDGIYTRTDAANSNGLVILTNADGSKGISMMTTGADSDGVFVWTLGTGSPAFSATTYNDGSKGLAVETGGDDSHGISSSTDGADSDGLNVVTSGKDSEGLFARTLGDFSEGVNITTHGDYSDGLNVRTVGYESDGIVVNTSGTHSEGILVDTYLNQAEGIIAHTRNNYSDGIVSATEGIESEGIVASTDGNYSEGVYVDTDGQASHGINIRTRYWGSKGIYVWSEHDDAIFARTGNSSSYGLYTDSYIYAHGTKYPAADVAEYMPVTESVGPGTVLVIGDSGRLEPATAAYDTRVAGIVSTDPGVTLGTKEGGGNAGEAIIAVAGRVPCRVDAAYGAIHPGDVLTTSPTPGHAMKAEPVSIGGMEIFKPSTVLGKAMGTLETGTGTIDVLVTFQ